MGGNWVSFGSALKNENYIEKLLKKHKIENYMFSHNGYGDYDLYLNINIDTYKISVDEINSCLNIYKKDIFRKAQKRRKEYFIFKKKVTGYDCWLDSIKYVVSLNIV